MEKYTIPRDYAPDNHLPRNKPLGLIGMVAAWLALAVLCLFAIIGAYTVLNWVMG